MRFACFQQLLIGPDSEGAHCSGAPNCTNLLLQLLGLSTNGFREHIVTPLSLLYWPYGIAWHANLKLVTFEATNQIIINYIALTFFIMPKP